MANSERVHGTGGGPQVPYELHSSGYRYRPGPLERWQRFDPAVQTLAAVANSHELGRAALGLADELEAALAQNAAGAEGKAAPVVACSFCGKPNTEVQKIITGPGTCICDECVALCISILEEQPPG
jgi:hypothetical protein